VIFYKYETVG